MLWKGLPVRRVCDVFSMNFHSEIGGDGKRPYGITRNHREKPVYSEPRESLGRPAWPEDNLQHASLMIHLLVKWLTSRFLSGF